MTTCKISGFEYLVKTIEYEFKTLQQIMKMKEEGIDERKIAETVGVGVTEVRLATHGKLNKAKKQLSEYKKRMNGGK